jgi:hypothetical protein
MENDIETSEYKPPRRNERAIAALQQQMREEPYEYGFDKIFGHFPPLVVEVLD